MTPLEIEILLHCYYSPEPLDCRGAPARKAVLATFLEASVIEPDNDSVGVYRVTPLGRAWVKAICDTPMPRQVYVDATGKVIE